MLVSHPLSSSSLVPLTGNGAFFSQQSAEGPAHYVCWWFVHVIPRRHPPREETRNNPQGKTSSGTGGRGPWRLRPALFILCCVMSLEPTKKSPQIETLITHMFGIDRVAQIKNRVCVFCGVSVNEDSFKDELSKKEYTISGICQSCQDKTFG